MLLGIRLGDEIVEAYNRGEIDLNKVTLIGHSLGAHVAGIAGKRVFSKLNKKLKRIIGATPSGIFFSHAKPEDRLSNDDAECVAVVHTNMDILGYGKSVGGLDFYVNGGIHQPGCNGFFSKCFIGCL